MILASSAVAFFGIGSPQVQRNGGTDVSPVHSGLSLTRSSRLRRRILIRPLILALFIRTRDHRPRLQIFLNQKFMTAARTLLGDRLVRRSELALGVIAAPIKRVSLARPFLNQFSVFASRTFHTDEILLHIFAFRISAAGSELPIAPMPDHHIPLALRAKFFERNIRHPLALIQPSRRL